MAQFPFSGAAHLAQRFMRLWSNVADADPGTDKLRSEEEGASRREPLASAYLYQRNAREASAAPAVPTADAVDDLTGMLVARALAARLQRLADVGGAVALLDLAIFGPEIPEAPVMDDAVRRAIGRVVLGTLRPDDACVRLEGNEVCLLLPGLQRASDAASVAERVRAAVGSVHIHDAPGYVVRASLGLALVRAGDNAESALDRARAALRDTRVFGLDQFVIDTRSQTKRAA